MKLRLPLLGLLALLLASSCVSGKRITYYQNMEAVEKEAAAAKKGLQIKPNDLLTISVAAESLEAVQPFNLPVVGMPSTGDATRVSGQPQLQTYLVDSDGNIEFPVLGTVQVAGLNRQQVSELIEERVAEYVQNPIVNVRIVNFQVTVLGEVNKPGTFSVPDEYLSLNKALGFAGDLSIYGKRENVLIIRETLEGKTYNYVDLTDAGLLNSPFYYLQQNDVVYVEPNNAQKQSAAYNRNASVYISIASVLISLAILLTN
ncbi:polysaccharide biosynthesis/export family protein [Salinimicrobium tongyeongense]|uniref:Polysaccharide biosynthesis/export family protein n=1 Tax=Salinimicrobium tongyeongense TaxID=2809707 RepID=A0ABY6NPC1_9FLAO|nr:polysaccharide biosynthesis/export family protein [Salinimicrobium tongyeongense]UZH54639.1 polysaccharide biosynthesis/export family protein [Salinimicrobium tongyeongense]